MSNLILDNLILIVMLPLWMFLIIMLGRFFSVYVNKWIIYTLTLVSSFIGSVTCAIAYFNIVNPIEWSLPFININDFVLTFGVRVDKTSLILAVLLFVISFLVQMFSVSYIKDEPKSYRFFALLNLFNFSMAFLIFSHNLFQFYVFWEIVGIVSYLLIGFDYGKEEKSVASKRVFIINRIGDTALIGAIIFVSYFMYNYSGNKQLTSLSFDDMNSISAILSAYNSGENYIAICMLFILAAMVKSAQFPFHTWLQDAMEAKLPVSALLHSATMVVAGVYLIMQIMPILSMDKHLMDCISLIGIITVIVCSIMACFESHPKRVLAYSTSANLGLMFCGLGVGNINAVLIFLVVHAIIKSGLFLSLPKDDNSWSYTKFILFVINALTLGGICFAGYVSKEILYNAVNGEVLRISVVLFILPAIYISKLAYSLFKISRLENKINWIESVPVILLCLLNVVFYIVFRNSFEHIIPRILLFFAVAAGILLSYTKIKLPKLIEYFNNCCITYIYDKIVYCADFVEQKIFSNYKPVILSVQTCVKGINLIEENIMNKSIKKITDFCKFVSIHDSLIQNKNVQSYNAYAFIIITVIVMSLMLLIGRLS